MAITVRDPWDGEEAHYASEVHVADRPEISRLLGPDGKPLRYERPVVGFDLRHPNDRGRA